MKLTSSPFVTTIILISLAYIDFGVAARSLSPDEALRRIKDSKIYCQDKGSKYSRELRKVIKCKNENTAALYIFTDNTKNNGYIVTPADDRFPAVIGYGDFYTDSMPPAMKWWLNCYSEEISIASSTVDEEDTNIYSYTTERLEPIQPLVKTKWNQDYPYNLYSPEAESSGTMVKCPTGCVATSMAQVMKYHNWPPQGKGYSEYSWIDSEGVRHDFSTDFSKFVFNWDKMLDKYSFTNNEDGSTTPLFTDAQADAVAKLMYACGMAEKMNFNLMGSGAQTSDIPHSLTEYFDYSNDVRFLTRAFTTTSEWERIIYNSLRDYGPVIYNGRDDYGGHSFICDGYDGDGFYHFNWGWGGMSDGYFRFFRLNPGNQGIGSFEGGYNLAQNIIFNIRPRKQGEISSKQNIIIQAGGDLVGSSPSATYGSCFFTTSNSKDDLWTGFLNNSADVINGCFAIRIIDHNLKESIVKGQEFSGLQPGYLYSNFFVDITGLSMGEYQVYAGFIRQGTDDFIPFEYPVGCRDHSKMIISKNGYVMVSNEPDSHNNEAVVTHLDYTNTIERGEVYDMTFHLANLNKDIDYDNYTRCVIRDNTGNEVYAFRTFTSVPGGYSAEFPISLTFPFSEGRYSMEFQSSAGNKISRSFYFTITDSFSETSPKEIRVSNISYVSGYEPMLTLKVSFIVPEPTVDYYNYYVKIFDENKNYIDEYLCHSDTKFDWVTSGKIFAPSYQMIKATDDVYFVKAYKRLCHMADRSPVNGDEVEISKLFRIDLNVNSTTDIREVKLRDVPESIKVNESYNINADIFPSEFSNSRLYWTSTDENVFIVNDTGEIIGLGEGTAKIVVSSKNGKFDYRELKVNGNSATTPVAVGQNEDTIDAVYNLNGIRILDKPSSEAIRNLPKGIYIMRTSGCIRKLAI